MTDIGQVGDPRSETEVAFWSRQLSEHALFFSLGIEDQALRNQAKALHEAWERARPAITAPQALALARDLRDYKTELLARLDRGQWLGWIFPTFVDHTRRELDLFVARLSGPVAITVDAEAWLRFMAEHAAFAAHLVDPIEAKVIKQALEFVGGFTRLQQECRSAVNDQILSLSTRSGAALDAFFTGPVTHAKSVIHPVLAVHVVREGRRFLRAVAAMRRVS